jgi:phospholipase/lecithinase/hemolysin
MPHRLVCLAALFVVTLGGSTRAGQFTGIVSFGDSLSDTGNTFLAADIPTSPPYYQGHYSNGPIWLEYFAASQGLPAPKPSLAPGGTDYAYGGAQTGDGTSFMGTPNVGSQISMYLGAHSPTTGQLITLWAGANDFLNAGVTDPSIPVANLASEIKTLAAAGGKSFLVANLPLLGNLPATNTLPQAQRDGLNFLSASFDTMLNSELYSLQNSLHVTIYHLDVESLFADAMSHPSKYGFTNVTDALLKSPDPTQPGYLFWDTVHPTTQAGRFIGDLAATSVPEPSSITLLVGAALTLVVGRNALGMRRPA